VTARAPLRTTASASDLATRIDRIRETPDAAHALTAMLAEEAPFFAGRGANEAERLRGGILASFETTGLPMQAFPYVLEELETGRNPYTVAGAARALRGATTVPAEAPALLVGAIARLQGTDDVVSFERFEPSHVSAGAVTALAEIARTLAFLGPRAKPALAALKTLIHAEGDSFSPAVRVELARAKEAIARVEVATPAPQPSHGVCCCAERPPEQVTHSPAGVVTRKVADLALENQDGIRGTFSDVFRGRPTALAFFYTRCNNPDKCSLTVTRLARLARRVLTEGLDANVAGITYDPAFDRPARLRTYGADRGMVFSERCSLLRTVGPFDPVREAFDLGVGFGPVTVNRHRLDVVVLDASLGVAQRSQRRLWREETVLDALRRVIGHRGSASDLMPDEAACTRP
jgi:cytochrome oxidase Cu insertion factor (SCO1/SenC/PrrC family)